MMVGAYTFLFFRAEREMGILPAAAASAACTILLGIFTLAIFIRPFLRSSSLLPLITTIALGTILESVVSMAFGVNVRSLPTESSGESIEWHGIFITQIQLLIMGSSLAIFGVLGFSIHLTSLGRRIRALAENPTAAESLGVSRSIMTYGVFTLSMLLGAYAGILVGYD